MKKGPTWDAEQIIGSYEMLAGDTSDPEFYRHFLDIVRELLDARIEELKPLHLGTSHSTLCISMSPERWWSTPGETMRVVPVKDPQLVRLEVEYRFMVGATHNMLTHMLISPVGNLLPSFDHVLREFRRMRDLDGRAAAIRGEELR